MDTKEKKMTKREREAACWFYATPTLSTKSMRVIEETYGSYQAAYKAGKDDFEKLTLPRGASKEALLSHYKEETPKELSLRLLEQGIGFVNVTEQAYPKRLAQIPDPPFGLFYLGALPAQDAPSVAIIGARECSEYGRYVAAGLGDFLGRHGVQVISGMARGIDGISQEAALNAGGSSFGVLGSGVDICYPASNHGIYEKLKEQGGVLSEYGPGCPPSASNFPMRNRIVSGLCDILVVVEARMKSGTMITVDMALEQGREVYVVPGRVTDRLSDGCNHLAKLGAEIFLSPELFLEELLRLRQGIGEKQKETPKQEEENSEEESEDEGEKELLFAKRKLSTKLHELSREKMPGLRPRFPIQSTELYAVWKALDLVPRSNVEIAGKLGKEAELSDVTGMLMQLVLDGNAKQVGNGSFVRIAGQ